MAMSPQNPPVEDLRDTVVIPNMYGEKLEGTLHEAGTTDIVILCHGFHFSSLRGYKNHIESCCCVKNAKIRSFCFDFYGNGESGGLFQHGGHWKEVYDLLAVVQHFYESNRNIYAIVGHSKGGGTVLLYASKYHDITTVINISGCFDRKAAIENFLGKDYLERIRKDGFIDVKSRRSESLDFRVTEESLMGCLTINMLDACLHIGKECR